MENMSKALLISAGVLVSIILLSILVYEIATTSNIAHSIQEKQYNKRILEFNAQFEGYSDRNERGYAGIRNAISVQEFAKIYNMALEWNKSNPSEKIKISLIGLAEGSKTINGSIINTLNNQYFKDLEKVPTEETLPPIENLFLEMEGKSGTNNNIENYYFEFLAENMEYSSLTKRIKQIKFRIGRIN